MNGKTPISALQEVMAARKLPLPVYLEQSHGAMFKCTVTAAGVQGVGLGPSKKAAKHASAQNALDKLQSQPKSPQIIILEQTPPPPPPTLLKNYVGELNEFASKGGVRYPDYEECVHGTLYNVFFTKCSFLGKEVLGRGANKKEAKQDAARNMLDLVGAMDSKTVLMEEKYKTLLPTKILEVPNKDEIIAIYKNLSISTNPKTVATHNTTLEPSPDIQLSDEDTIEVLEAKMKHYGIRYTVDELQRHPYVIYVRIKGTDLYFCGHGTTKDEAIRRGLHQALEVKRSGCSLDTNDLISLD